MNQTFTSQPAEPLANTSPEAIEGILKSQKSFFQSGASLELTFRQNMLRNLLQALGQYEQALCDALWHDLHKSYEEAFLTEISIVRAEIKTHLKHLKTWARKEKVHTPLTLTGSRSYVVKEPLGTALIVAPWNYPVNLLLNPLIGAISAGCTAVLKPSPYVPRVSKVLEEMIRSVFPESYIAVVQGNREVNTCLFQQRFDLIFFTGSPALARTVAAAAAPNLTPMILELGGKSPCIVHRDADIAMAAKRIAWGKTVNAGQTCIAPDYILIHKDVKEEFIKCFADSIRQLHGEDIRQSGHFVRMVSDKAFQRVQSYLKEGTIVYGGRCLAEERFIEPTLLDGLSPDADILHEEIFGPVFPLITLDGNDESFSEQVVRYVNEREKPLAFYFFGPEEIGWELIHQTSSGGGCLNDTIMHIANPTLPFGGVGNSGMGHYHGKDSFEAFTHRRSVVSSSTRIDLPFRYMPYRFFHYIRKVL